MGSKYGRLVNDFFHDIAAGLFPGAATAAWVIQRQAGASGGSKIPASAVGGIWMILVLGLVVSVATGIFRLRYHSAHVKPELVEARNGTALIKHVAFVTLLLVAAVVFGTATAG